MSVEVRVEQRLFFLSLSSDFSRLEMYVCVCVHACVRVYVKTAICLWKLELSSCFFFFFLSPQTSQDCVCLLRLQSVCGSESGG